MPNCLSPTSKFDQLNIQIPSNASGVIARTPLKKPSLAQKKPLEALGSSPPPPR